MVGLERPGRRGRGPTRCCLLLLLVAVMGACSASAGSQGNEAARQREAAAVRQVFAGFRTAFLAADGRGVASAMSAATIQYFEELRGLAVGGGPQDFAQRPLLDRFAATLLRVRIPAEQLRRASSQELAGSAITSGLVERELLADAEIGEVDVTGDVANGVLTYSGEPSRVSFTFLREGGQWKIDLTPLRELADFALVQMARSRGLEEDQLVFQLARERTGRPVDASVYQRRPE